MANTQTTGSEGAVQIQPYPLLPCKAEDFMCECDPDLFRAWRDTPQEKKADFVAAIVNEALETDLVLDPADVEAELNLRASEKRFIVKYLYWPKSHSRPKKAPADCGEIDFYTVDAKAAKAKALENLLSPARWGSLHLWVVEA